MAGRLLAAPVTTGAEPTVNGTPGPVVTAEKVSPLAETSSSCIVFARKSSAGPGVVNWPGGLQLDSAEASSNERHSDSRPRISSGVRRRVSTGTTPTMIRCWS